MTMDYISVRRVCVNTIKTVIDMSSVLKGMSMDSQGIYQVQVSIWSTNLRSVR